MWIARGCPVDSTLDLKQASLVAEFIRAFSKLQGGNGNFYIELETWSGTGTQYDIIICEAQAALAFQGSSLQICQGSGTEHALQNLCSFRA